ncbi:MAG: PHP domain-containing protein [Chloroflexi bacterium]|nr:PHP domain-containing protein [Chloroflexota bacterium]
MGKADIHIHTTHSDGMATVEQVLEYVEHETDLDLIAITDHDMFDGADEARNLAAQRNYRFQVLTGMEVTTIEGHLLVLGIDKPVRSLQRLDKTIAQVHEQGGIVIAPHPMSWMIRSIGRNGLMRIHYHPSDAISFDGFETLNPSIAGRVVVKQVRELNSRVLQLAETGGSDSHVLPTIGTATTVFPGSTADDLRRALAEKTTTVEGHFWTREEMRYLAKIGPRQLYQSLVKLPAKHIKRLVASYRRRNGHG